MQYEGAYAVKQTSFEVVEQDGSADGVTRGTWSKDGLDVLVEGGLKEMGAIVDRRKHAIHFFNASSVSDVFWVADARYVVETVNARFRVAGSTGASLQIEVVPSGTAPEAGVDQLAAVIDLENGTVNTNLPGTLIASPTVINPGDGLGVVLAGTLTNLAGASVTVTLKRVR